MYYFMETKTIKNVDEETWREFKTLSVKNNLKMSLLLKIMIKEFEKNSEKFWNKILKGGKNLSDNEANEMMNTVLDSRK